MRKVKKGAKPVAPKEIKKPQLNGRQKELRRQALQFLANKKNRNLTMNAPTVKVVKAPGGKPILLKKFTKQTTRSLANPRSLLREKKMKKDMRLRMNSGKTSKTLLRVVGAIKAQKVNEIRRQKAKDAGEKRFRFMPSVQLPKTYTGKYAPEKPKFRLLRVNNVPQK